MKAINISTAVLLCVLGATASTQSPVDLGTVARIKQEALTNSQAMDHVSWLSDVYGPRVTGTPNYARAAEWAMKRMTEWGLANVHQERFAFGQGWRVERFSAHIVAPEPQPIIGFPRTYSPSTSGPVTADVVRVDIRTDADFARYQGQLKGKIVLPQPARAVRMLEDRIVLRMNEQDIAEALTTPIPGAPGAPGAKTEAGKPSLNERIAQFYVSEGVAALIERGSDNHSVSGGSNLSWTAQRVDGGTIFPGGGGSRDPKAPAQVPSATIAVEHYNRMVRVLDKGVPVRVELNIQTTFFPEAATAPNGINVIGEIPGTDLANEVVILGAHLDTTPAGTGATDNATGSAAMMEAMRVITALGLRPRRTIRLALWGGEEQGLLGSRAYVAEHYGSATKPKPGHGTVAGYYNLDNGTGRIRGIWGQSNLGAMLLFRQWIESVRDLGVEFVAPRAVSATDHASFEQAGIPGFQFMQERLEYGSRTHHSNMDFVDRVQREDLVQQATVAAVFAWYTANWPDRLPRKTIATPGGTAQ
ncbi:MAG TPA: M20/M25/M40 family metallo-hydrolase [Vicinamibacterales bacterium]|nr:M20/M25/M40 family metallo-hydrolase [Vicinamibacterales bacterium]